ncbi:mechanosensitive ion channel family protein [Granulosicoccaceae sp. 1_MG-2023]|nr:mechanosensitive ion channel family protein [Granulosicoccaceae sp. 1_MG-2023]
MKAWLTEFFNSTFQIDLSDRPVEMWLIAIAVAFAVFSLLKLALGLVSRRLERLSARTQTRIDDGVIRVLRKTRWWMLLLLAVNAGALFVDLPGSGRTVLQNTLVVAGLIQAGLWASTALQFYLGLQREKQIRDNPGSVTALNAVGILGSVLLWLAVLLLALDNLGVDVTALIAGLGVGGIAVALAVQNVLGDLLASLSILTDKPFEVGDFIQVDDLSGSVEKVGLKTTRVRSLSGEQLVFSNSDLLASRLRNYGRMYQRRVQVQIGVTYDTPRDKLEAIPGMIREAISGQGQTRFERAHFTGFGDFSLNFESVYYVQSGDYTLHMDIQQAINLQIHKAFEEAGIDFAFPTQMLYLKNADGTPLEVKTPASAAAGTSSQVTAG